MCAHLPFEAGPLKNPALLARTVSLCCHSLTTIMHGLKRHMCINIGELNISSFCWKLPIAKVYFSPIFCLVRYIDYIEFIERYTNS